MLEKIKTPEQIKRLHYNELIELAEDVRKRIIDVTSKNGGHIAPSLGATDFIIAMLKVFNPLQDRIVFDVGHQSYAYKILTERNERFDTLRTYEGISGFNNIFESPYDAFGVGHSSTSISAALGICLAKEMQKEKGHSIAVIGDGALTGGMAFEALNHAGHLQKNFIVVLNDNEMSISKNVGALQNHLANMMTSKSYNYLKKQVWDKSSVLPTKMRRRFITGAQKLEESLINILVPNIFFEDLNFKYVGPIDGHDIPRLVRIFNKVKDNMEGPVLIHLITKKGKGYSFAEKQVSKFHGIGPFDLKTGDVCSAKQASWSEVFGSKLISLSEKNKKIVAITAAMADGTGLTEFSKK
ncbi:MAG TPA: 1-deoxy-D-xylulose-5-phosphate synthase N-terminal domain-containing protein, partial [Candidatus Cloacimonadota bacterium]|nr:1-deoxy-D-xylulose-5-phosphate synthase N-terminal domain-containing protein [Candidatus Cloacimonadota bacterium]